MSLDEDNPVNPNRDMSDFAVMRRYTEANLMAIVTSSHVVFNSLADIPRLVKERKELLTQLEECRNFDCGGTTHAGNSGRDDEKDQSQS